MTQQALLWELFLMVKDLTNKVEPTAENTRKQNEWAMKYRGLPAPDDVEAQEATPPPTPLAQSAEAEPEDEPEDDPHEHGTPSRVRSAPGKRRR